MHLQFSHAKVNTYLQSLFGLVSAPVVKRKKCIHKYNLHCSALNKVHLRSIKEGTGPLRTVKIFYFMILCLLCVIWVLCATTLEQSAHSVIVLL